MSGRDARRVDVRPDVASGASVDSDVVPLQRLIAPSGLASVVSTEGKYGQTLENRAPGVAGVTADGDAVDDGDALVRNVLRVVDALAGSP